MRSSLNIVCLLFTIELGHSFPQNDLNRDSVSDSETLSDFNSNVPSHQNSNELADQAFDSHENGDSVYANTLDSSCIHESERPTEKRNTINMPIATIGEPERSRPPFDCKYNKKPACCVESFLYGILCMAWDLAEVISCLIVEDYGCCASFDKQGYGVDCDRDFVLHSTMKKKKPAFCPAG